VDWTAHPHKYTQHLSHWRKKAHIQPYHKTISGHTRPFWQAERRRGARRARGVAAIHKAVHDDGEGGVGEGGARGAQPAASTRSSGGGCSARGAASRRRAPVAAATAAAAAARIAATRTRRRARQRQAALRRAARSRRCRHHRCCRCRHCCSAAAGAAAAATAAAAVAPPPPVSAAAAGVAISALGARHDVAEHRERCRSVRLLMVHRRCVG
jgi:hypothetical protein